MTKYLEFLQKYIESILKFFGSFKDRALTDDFMDNHKIIIGELFIANEGIKCTLSYLRRTKNFCIAALNGYLDYYLSKNLLTIHKLDKTKMDDPYYLIEMTLKQGSFRLSQNEFNVISSIEHVDNDNVSIENLQEYIDIVESFNLEDEVNLDDLNISNINEKYKLCKNISASNIINNWSSFIEKLENYVQRREDLNKIIQLIE